MSGLKILHGCRTLQLTRRQNTLIDESDFQAVGQWSWYSLPSNSKKEGFYAVHTVNRLPRAPERVFMHRAIMGAAAGAYVDHRNGDGLDNRRANLRITSQRQNTQNTRVVVGASRFKGVGRCTGSRTWHARIRVNGTLIHLGCFRSQEQAAHAYDAAAREHFGEFACTNADIYGEY